MQTTIFLKTFIPALILFVGVLYCATNAYVQALHNKGTYPSVGHLWMSSSSGYFGVLFNSSTKCSSTETGAYARIKSSTTGTSEMPEWKNGIDMRQSNCSGAWNNSIDIKLNYVATHPTPGENFDVKNTSSYCAYWGVSYPCGVRSQVKINQAWWDKASSLSRQRLLMHETGHSLGLGHLCSSNSIMNDGTSGCNLGQWTQVMSYQSSDRKSINAVY
ncbi:MAG: Matrixin [Candidatus Parcubacteria bacterium]|jgi:hypothetical protein